MTILVTSDVHWSSNPRDEYRHKFVKTLRTLIKEYAVDTLLILGDLTETKDRHDAELVNRVVGHIDRLARSVDRLILLRGNHDWLNDPEIPFFKFLGRLPNVTWINKPTVIDDLGIFLPHTTDYKKDWAEFIEEFKDHYFIFAHNTFEGAVDNDRKLDGIPTDMFPENVAVISGDVHTPQLGPVTYVGAPYTIDFGDDYEPRVLFIDRGKVLSMPVEGPMKRLVEGTAGEEARVTTTGLHEGDILKIRVRIQRAEVPQWAKIRQQYRDWGESHGYLVHVVQPVLIDADKRMDTAKRKRLGKSDEDLFDQYCKRMDIDDKSAAVGRAILGEA